MADEPNEFSALMERVSLGDEQAAKELFDRYHEALIRVIRYRLNLFPQLRTQFDSFDFLQEVWQDVFADPEKLHEFATFEGFRMFLAQVARHKVEKAQRKYAAQKRDLHRHRNLGDPGVGAAAAAVADPRPNPAQQAASHEAWMDWLRSLLPRQQLIVLMLRNGCPYQEIAAELSCSVRTIKRLVAEIREMPVPSW
jgi:RNA polymerase sigma factor (sigma-70 family)